MIEEGKRKGASNIPSGSYECTEFLVIGLFSFSTTICSFPIAKCCCGKYGKILSSIFHLTFPQGKLVHIIFLKAF